MTHRSLPRKRLIHRSLTVCLGGLLLGGLTTAQASAAAKNSRIENSHTDLTAQAQLPVDEQKRPTLRNLLLTVPDRPIAPQPAANPPVITPSDTDTPATTAPAQSEEQTVRLLLKLSERKVYVYQGDSVEAVYPVAVGRAGWETPTGEFSVLYQTTDPGWTNPLTGEVMPPGDNNPLGDRWIAFWTDDVNLIGFHGTPNRDSVGTAASHGCIRMYNEDVRELYEMVSVGTPVTVQL